MSLQRLAARLRELADEVEETNAMIDSIRPDAENGDWSMQIASMGSVRSIPKTAAFLADELKAELRARAFYIPVLMRTGEDRILAFEKALDALMREASEGQRRK